MHVGEENCKAKEVKIYLLKEEKKQIDSEIATKPFETRTQKRWEAQQ
jgi:hypothetical protein